MRPRRALVALAVFAVCLGVLARVASGASPDSDAPSMAVALADSTRVDSASAVVVLVAADTSSAPPAELPAIAKHIGPRDHVRVTGAFGRFQGYVGVVGPFGLEHIVVKPDAPEEWRPHNLPKRIPWSAIDGVHMRRGNARTGAVAGGITFAIVGGLLTAAAASLADSYSPKPGEAAIVGGAVSGAIGVVVGAGIGSAFRHWAVVYRRP
jgi:hypothetical protein